MPLNPNLKKNKTEEEKERAYTRPTSYTKKNENKTSYKPVMTDAKAAAQGIKKDTIIKTSGRDLPKKSTTKRELYRNEIKDKGTTRTSNTELSQEKGRGMNADERSSVKKYLREKSFDSQNRKADKPHGGVNRESVQKHKKQERKLNENQRDEQLWNLSTNAGGKFISNTYDSLLDNSPVGAVATVATGERPSNYFNQNNPYNTYRQQGLSAGAGRMAGMAINYGLARSAITKPFLEPATEAVMNGTKLGNAIKSSAALGKIGQKVGNVTAQDIASGLVRETISDATLGFGQNALINYGEGLRGKDFWKQQALDTALDFAIGGAMEGTGIGRQVRQASKDANSVIRQNAMSLLENSATRKEYETNLKKQLKKLIDIRDNGNASMWRRQASEERIEELIGEYRKAVNIVDDDQFAKYKNDTLGIAETAEEIPEEVAKQTETPFDEDVVEEPVSEVAPATASGKLKGFERTRAVKGAQGRYDAYGNRIGREKSYNVTVSESGDVKVNPAEPVVKQTTKTSYVRPEHVNKEYEETYKQYIDSVDDGAVQYINNFRNKVKQKKYYSFGKVSAETAEKTKGIVGIDSTGFDVRLDAEGLKHPEKRHGINGKADSTMADPNDYARAKWAMENADAVEDAGNSNVWRNANGKPAKKVKYTTRIDGHYYVIEAVPDSAKKTTHIEDVYIGTSDIKKAEKAEKKKKIKGAIHNTESAPQQTPKTVAFNSSSEKTITQKESIVNAKADSNKLIDDQEDLVLEPEVKADKKGNALPTQEEAKAEKPANIRTALVRDDKGNLKPIRKEGYKSAKAFESELRSNGYKVLKTWNGDQTDEAVSEWASLHRKKTAKNAGQGNGLPNQAEIKATEEATTKEVAKEERPKAKVYISLNKDEIAKRMKEAGVELPEDLKGITKSDLIAYNKGEIDLDALAGKKKTRATKNTEVDLFEYEDIYNSDAYNRNDSLIKEKLLDRYVQNYKDLGRPLSQPEIDDLKQLNADSLFEHIQSDALERAGYKTADEYHANRLWAEEEPGRSPELVRRADAHNEELKQDALRKGKSDSYTSEPTKTDKYFGRIVKETNATDAEIASKIDAFLEPRMKDGVHPKIDIISKRLDLDEEDIVKYVERSDKYKIDGSKVTLKEEATDGIKASDAISQLNDNGEVLLGQYGRVKKNADGAYSLLKNGSAEEIVSKEEAEKYIADSVESLNAFLKEKAPAKGALPQKADVTANSSSVKGTNTISGSTYTFENTSNPKRALPKKLTKERGEAAVDRVLARRGQLNDEGFTKSNKAKKEKVVLDTSKLDELKIGSEGARTSLETGAPKEKTVKEKWDAWRKKLRRDVIDSSDELRRIDKAIGGNKLQEKHKMAQGSRAQAAYQLTKEITDRNGNKIADSFRSVFEPYKKHMDDINLYMFNQHEIERALQSNKNSLSLSIYGYTKEEASKVADSLTKIYPEMESQKSKIARWLEEGMQNNETYRNFKKSYDGFDNVIQRLNQIKSDQAKETVNALKAKYKKQGIDLDKLTSDWNKSYQKWFDEWAVNSGLVNKEVVKNWRGKYHNYIPTFRVQEIGSGAMNILDTPDVFHAVKGKNGAKLLSVEDQIGIMINRVTSAARRNELNLSILEAIKKNPDKGFGRIISTSSEKIGDIDVALGKVASSSSDIINGGKKLTVLDHGKEITLEISDDLAATLRAMQDGADTGTMTRIGKWITNPIKLGITGANPTFVVSNAVRDMATALIQSEHGMHKTVSGWGKALAGMTGANKEYAELLKRYKFAGGEMAGYYVQGKGFDTSAILQKKGVKGVLNKVGEIITFLGEQGETIPRFGEFINTMEKTGDFYKAIRDASEVTVDFSKHGASDGAKLLDAYTLYLNAGLQGIDKFARTLAEHPVRTSVRTSLVVGTPAMALLAINHDNPWYHELSDRTRQNYFCIPKLDGEKDEDGNCKEFIRLPMNREYGAILGAGIDCIWRAIKGEERPTSGFATTLAENFLPNNPITDNVLAPLLINIPSNRDYKGSKILTSSEYEDMKAGKNADLQYDASTSGTAMKVSELANRIMGDKNIPILKYLKSPKLVDYVLDSYGGYYGQIAQAGTQQGVENIGDVAKNVLVQPYINKFNADPRYSSKSYDMAWDKIAEYKADQTRAASEGKEWSEAHAKYEAANTVMKGIYDSLDAEKEIKNDPNLSDDEKKRLINELREARLEMAKTIDTEAEKAAQEYNEAPTYSSLGQDVKSKWNQSLGMTKEEWAKEYKLITDTYNNKKESTGKGTTIEEKRFQLLEDGVTSYKVAQSIFGETTSEDKWNDAVDAFKKGKTLEEVEEEARLQAEKEEAQKDMTKEEKNFENYFKTNVTTQYDGKTVKKSVIDEYISRAKYADEQNGGNGSITQPEARAALDSMDLTRAQKAYLWSITKDWKTNPYN